MSTRRDFLKSLIVAGSAVTLMPQLLLPSTFSAQDAYDDVRMEFSADAFYETDLAQFGEAMHYSLDTRVKPSEMVEYMRDHHQRFARKVWQDRRMYIIPESVQFIHKPLGSGGTIDPINQIASLAWKAYGFAAPAWMTYEQCQRAGAQLWANRGFGTRVKIPKVHEVRMVSA